MIKQPPQQEGFILATLIGVMVAMSVVMISLITVINANMSLVQTNNNSQKAFNIAEAGINYYLWHISHNATDYKDGQTTPATADPALGYGPYEHQYIDDNLVNQGTYTLWIKPQGAGSTIVTVRSIGKVKSTNETRTIEAQLGAPSFASYVLVSDSALAFGSTSTAGGPVHSNVGVRMDAPNTDDVTSANATYNDGGTTRNGVWCSSGSPNCAARTASNSNGTWRFPVPSVDFNAVTGDICNLKKTAFASVASTASLASMSNACSQVPTTRTAAYVPRNSANISSFSSTEGYLVELNTDGTYNLYSVAGENFSAANYTWQLALNETLVASNIVIPDSAVIFVEDNVWVRTNPTYHGRVTIASGRLASTSQETNIVLADDIKYSTKNGQDSIGLTAEQNVWLAAYAPPRPTDPASSYPFEVDAAIIAKEGNFGIQDNYNGQDFPAWDDPTKTLSFYGSIAVRGSSGWRIDRNPGEDDGFGYRTNDYDYNLLYAPPPSFPVTSSYNILSWREVVTHP